MPTVLSVNLGTTPRIRGAARTTIDKKPLPG
ncbi:hypothetical protein KIPE111705_36405 [Kibdelosporangium persicum]